MCGGRGREEHTATACRSGSYFYWVQEWGCRVSPAHSLLVTLRHEWKFKAWEDKTNKQVGQIVIALGVGGRPRVVWLAMCLFKTVLLKVDDCFEMGVSFKWRPHNQTLGQALASQKE